MPLPNTATVEVSNEPPGFPNPLCFEVDGCFGVNETTYGHPISIFCGAMVDFPFSNNGSPGTISGKQWTWDYIPQPGTNEQGHIALSLFPTGDPTCGTFSLDYSTCVYNFNVPKMLCNTDTPDFKQGGNWAVPCFHVTVQPNPDICQAS
ncbi:hypothetical protein LTR37_005124 [Vermiconidia calcicola]|uniref:Uncharacterized protein n=1 Tax=Vermiconidia calcicola TaxID=1690605 RepID=A0ACC3NK79_9PEZI|nr:hypothetical protein LTR37_005124 [Vermiconidia calcicola]